MILNQRRTGKPCPQQVANLHSELTTGSLMCWIKVHAFDLATILDRLECLEEFQARALRLSGELSNHKSVD